MVVIPLLTAPSSDDREPAHDLWLGHTHWLRAQYSQILMLMLMLMLMLAKVRAAHPWQRRSPCGPASLPT
jgi:hypothetical protein